MAEERLELVPHYRDSVVYVLLLLILLPVETDPVSKERCGKRDLVRPRSFSSSRIVFTLLIEVVAVHVGLSVVYVQGTGLQLLPKRLKDNGS